MNSEREAGRQRRVAYMEAARSEPPLTEWRQAWLTAYPSMLSILLDSLVIPWQTRLDRGESATQVASDPMVTPQDVSNITRLVKLERSIRDALERDAGVPLVPEPR